MTLSEARRIYLKSDCSHFTMCNNDYEGYLAYKRLEVSKEQENKWKNEKIRILYRELQKTGDYMLFNRLYEIAVEFRDYDKLRLLLNALDLIKQPMSNLERISVAETILGRKLTRVRSGMMYWAYDIGQRGITLLLYDYVEQYLDISTETDAELQKRIKRGMRLCKSIMKELGFRISSRKAAVIYSAYEYD